MRFNTQFGLLVLVGVLLLGTAVCSGLTAQDYEFSVELRWQGDADLDLIVTTPGGERLDYANPTVNGGTLVADANGFCNGESSTMVEQVVFPGDVVQDGAYFITVSYVFACEQQPEPISWEVVVRNGTEVVEHAGVLHPGQSMPVGRFVHN
jgi:hypothetical protein